MIKNKQEKTNKKHGNKSKKKLVLIYYLLDNLSSRLNKEFVWSFQEVLSDMGQIIRVPTVCVLQIIEQFVLKYFGHFGIMNNILTSTLDKSHATQRSFVCGKNLTPWQCH